MARTATRVAALLAAGAFAAAAAGRPSAVVPAARDGATELALGQVLEIALQAQAGSGHAWALEADGAPQLRRIERPGGRDAGAGGEPPRVGGATTQRWYFEAVGAGEATIRMRYQRPWLATPVRRAAFRVRVREGAPPPRAP